MSNTVDQDFENITLLTIHGLQVALKKEIGTLLDGMHLTDDSGNEVAFHGYEQQLPKLTEDEDDISEFFPYYIVQVFTGSAETDDDPWKTDVVIQLGIRDKGAENHGHIQLMSAIQKITDRFSDRPLFDNAFRADPKMSFELLNEDTYPYFFAAVSLSFEVPRIGRGNELI